MTFPVLVSAPGKLIITGEHAVVYGRAAVVAALQRRTFVHVTRAPDDISISIPQLGVQRHWSRDQITDHVIENEHQSVIAFVHLYNKLSSSVGPIMMKVEVRSELYVGAGLGSSSSYAVSLSAALLLVFGHIKDINQSLDIINSHAFELETLFHGKPSGVDNTTCCYGKVRFYDKRNEGDEVAKQQIVENLQIKVCIVNTNVPRSTKTLVSKVREQYDAFSEILEPILDSVGAISKQVFSHLTKLSQTGMDTENLYSEICSMLFYNQKLLETLSVSHVIVERVRDMARDRGLIGCKLTGAGGGGCLFIVIPPSMEVTDLMSDLHNAGLQYHVTCLGGDGVMLHTDTADWVQIKTQDVD